MSMTIAIPGQTGWPRIPFTMVAEVDGFDDIDDEDFDDDFDDDFEEELDEDEIFGDEFSDLDIPGAENDDDALADDDEEFEAEDSESTDDDTDK